ncbi:bifunctional uroporphyrinogen-III C-methyltransferase/uroporphyrinogen-III synthase [Tenggerimyces flavus]|uniref:uroporphyrinogen-III C-methyltransferase n=1 Tax=Tenggerimyces flavus TaxID=1708749 RepID=A0ABV7Y6C4_9ACTN|nr:bifunctional uroporphyrinogen-III C-methyltransferase/uroporphyrinogen-III synthase [Tenggerimyces flavus]MBM7791263.1 uroporphyrinogen III methyltransferase/synthase [Tenggerimyces flavus]
MTAKNKSNKKPVGSVAFVGAGPGDPALVTVRAQELLARADVVAGDLALHEGVLHAYVRADAMRLELTEETATPAEVVRVLAKHAKDGDHVVRLYPGDPFVEGHAAEHVAAIVRHHVPFEVAPGLSAATAVPSYSGTPLTSTKVREVRIADLTGGDPDWDTLAAGTATLVLTGVVDPIKDVVDLLVKAGRDGSTPASATVAGTSTQQKTVAGTLDTIAADLKAARLVGPYVLIVGANVALRDKLSWFETKPLFGWRVLVPRTKEQAGLLSDLLRQYGAVPEEVPTISVEPPRNPQQLDRAITGLVTGRYQWVAFTSVNAVRAVREKFEEYGLDARAFAGLKIAAVGDKTAEAIQAWGIKPDLVPSEDHSARGLVDEWPPYDRVLDPINRVFLPRADIATETLVAGLVELGWEVDDVTAYRTVRAAPPPAPVREAIKTGKFDAVAFTSSSTVRNLVGIAGKPHTTTVIAAIGEQTAKTADEHGLRVDVQPSAPSIETLAESLAEFGAARRLAQLEAGEPVTRPSERRSAARRRK